MNYSYSSFAKPLYVMLKPIGSVCNLNCSYCYYLEKRDLYPQESSFAMSEQVLESFIKQYLAAQTTPQVLFTWHGGETLLQPISFYKKALALQKKYATGRQVDNCLQTNGVLLNDDWCTFFKENKFLIGISIDGPQHCHDRYRKYRNGRSSFAEVMRGIELLKKHQVDFNVMAVVNDYNVNYPLEFYRFFKDLSVPFIQFAPIVETLADGSIAPWTVSPQNWGNFLIAVFDEWVRRDVGRVFVQYFDSTLANWMGQPAGICTLAKHCGHAGVMEYNGDVYACDHFVFPSFKRGNIHAQTLTEMMYSPKQIQFGIDKYESLPQQCKQCEYLFACWGECPKNRISTTPSGEPGLNYLCEGFYRFFKHVTPYMEYMRKELESQRSPATILTTFKK